MAAQAGFATHCAELLAAVGEVRSRRMFGGHGLYVDEVFVGIISGETLHLKVDEQTQSRFEAPPLSGRIPGPEPPPPS